MNDYDRLLIKLYMENFRFIVVDKEYEQLIEVENAVHFLQSLKEKL